jgi:hypothetical protein
MADLRPMRSAMLPQMTDPSAIPKSSMERTTPSTAWEMDHSLAIPGAAKLMDNTSNPSMPFSAMQSATNAICRQCMGPASRMRSILGSVHRPLK